MTPAMSIRMQRDIDPIRVIESSRRRIEFSLIEPTRWRPGIPHDASETARISAYGFLAQGCCHEPVIPIGTSLFERQGLRRVIGAITHRQHRQMRRQAGFQASSIRHRARAPIMAD